MVVILLITNTPQLLVSLEQAHSLQLCLEKFQFYATALEETSQGPKSYRKTFALSLPSSSQPFFCGIVDVPASAIPNSLLVIVVS